jgi:phage-related baseplate assembly protein
MTLPILPEPNFIARDPAAITAEMVAQYEAATGKTLQAAQVERLLVNQIAYRETVTRIGIQEAAKQNLLYYSRAPILDYLGELVGVLRLDATAARTTLRFTVPASVALDTLIPAGTRVSNGAGTAIFFTTEVGLLAIGETTIDLAAECETPGVAGNGWANGETAVLLDDLGVADVAVTTQAVSAGGAEGETDDRLRERIAAAPESFTSCGSRGAYRFWAMSAHQSIIDVSVLRAAAGVVRLHPLVETGLPAAPIIEAVAAICSDETRRPLCDTVQVLPPVVQEYAIAVRLTLLIGADGAAAVATVETALSELAADRAAGLGRDVVRWQIAAAAKAPGVYAAEVVSPAADLVLAEDRWASCTGVTVTISGFVRG